VSRPTLLGLAPVRAGSAPTPTKAPVSGAYSFVSKSIPFAPTTTHLRERIEAAVADAEYARLVGDRHRAKTAIYDAFALHRSLLRVERRCGTAVQSESV
jgi:hypothetical protein